MLLARESFQRGLQPHTRSTTSPNFHAGSVEHTARRRLGHSVRLCRLCVSGRTHAAARSASKGVPVAAIVIPCLFIPFIIAAVALYVIRRQRIEARRKLLDEFDRRSMFGTRGNDLFSTAKHDVAAPPRPGSMYSGYTPSSYAVPSANAAPSPYAAYSSPTQIAYGGTAPPPWSGGPGGTYAWQPVAPAESSAAWSALGVPPPSSTPSPLSPSPISPEDAEARRTLRVMNAQSIASVSSGGHEKPLLPPQPPGKELSDDTLKAWMDD